MTGLYLANELLIKFIAADNYPFVDLLTDFFPIDALKSFSNGVDLYSVHNLLSEFINFGMIVVFFGSFGGGASRTTQLKLRNSYQRANLEHAFTPSSTAPAFIQVELSTDQIPNGSRVALRLLIVRA